MILLSQQLIFPKDGGKAFSFLPSKTIPLHPLRREHNIYSKCHNNHDMKHRQRSHVRLGQTQQVTFQMILEYLTLLESFLKNHLNLLEKNYLKNSTAEPDTNVRIEINQLLGYC